jgi:hypothetical protein
MSQTLIEGTARRLLESKLNMDEAMTGIEREMIRLAFDATRAEDGSPDIKAASLRLGVSRDYINWLLSNRQRALSKELFGQRTRPPRRTVQPPSPVTDITAWRERRGASC